MTRLLASILASTAALAAFGQGMRFHEVVDGKTILAVVKPKDLPSDYWAVKVVMSGEFNFLDLYGGLAFQSSDFGGSGSNEERRRAKEALSQAAGVYWTRGEKVTVEGQYFLIAYRLDIPVAAIAGNSRAFDNWAMENALDLTLQLIRPDSIARMSPVPSLSPEKMAKAVSTFERSIAEELGVPPGTLVQGAGTNQSRQTAALSNAKQIGTGIIIYMSDYDDYFPPKPSTENVKKVTMPYTKNMSIWNTGNPNGSKFLFNPALAAVNASDVDNPAEMPLVYESTPWPDGRRAVVYADSHAKLISNAEWNKIAPLLKAKIKKSSHPSGVPPRSSPPPAPKPKPKPKKP